jgi:hypothetical protein
VVGIPPEVGPENENARSQAGFPWALNGDLNRQYLELARHRIEYLNKLGLVVIVYGAWGHQIEWLGKERMVEWWLAVVETLDLLDVVYCLCGESDLWVGEASNLLPAKSTDDLLSSQAVPWLPARLRGHAARAARSLREVLYEKQYQRRRQEWGFVLDRLAHETDKPVFVHPTADKLSYETVSNPGLLAADTVQTGHDEVTRNRLWQLPLALLEQGGTGRPFINLEPWYEGIRDQFWVEDQMFSYWVSMLAGAASYCYGAHGIWNVGDGRFLAHWGKQTFAEACALDTPRLLGLSHRQYMQSGVSEGQPFIHVEREDLICIGRRGGGRSVRFYPDIAKAEHVPTGNVWLPLEGVFSEALPPSGQVVVVVE